MPDPSSTLGAIIVAFCNLFAICNSFCKSKREFTPKLNPITGMAFAESDAYRKTKRQRDAYRDTWIENK